MTRMTPRQFRGYLRRTAREIRKMGPVEVKRAAQLGQRFAKSVSPFFTGATRDAIVLNFPEHNMAIIQARPAVGDGGFSTAVAFETNNFGRMTVRQRRGTPGIFIDAAGFPRVPFRPFIKRPTSIGFLSRTARFLDREFPKSVSKRIDTII